MPKDKKYWAEFEKIRAGVNCVWVLLHLSLYRNSGKQIESPSLGGEDAIKIIDWYTVQ